MSPTTDLDMTLDLSMTEEERTIVREARAELAELHAARTRRTISYRSLAASAAPVAAGLVFVFTSLASAVQS